MDRRTPAGGGLHPPGHGERGPGNPSTPNFIPPGYTLKDVTFHNVITEWHAANPAAPTFAGTRRINSLSSSPLAKDCTVTK